MKLLFLVITIFTTSVAWGESLLDNEVALGPVAQAPALIKLKVLDSFSGRTKSHGMVVQMLAENFWADDEAVKTLKYSVQVSHADVMKPHDEEELFVLSLQSSQTPEATKDAVVVADFLIALEQAGIEGVKVVNYSVASYFDSPNQFEYRQIVKTLEKYDMILVVPAGNEGLTANRYPCSYPHAQIVCVAAGKQSYVQLGPRGDMIVLDKYSNDNSFVKFVANGWFDKANGTSFASPRVAQALAFLWSYSPKSSAKEVVQKLQSYGRFVDNKTLAAKVAQQQSPFPFLGIPLK